MELSDDVVHQLLELVHERGEGVLHGRTLGPEGMVFGLGVFELSLGILTFLLGHGHRAEEPIVLLEQSEKRRAEVLTFLDPPRELLSSRFGGGLKHTCSLRSSGAHRARQRHVVPNVRRQP